ncbi:hypothetical protein CERSUDRAFT_97362 [Gelatoporia subvermispora B]|uniref:Uncharacterized protein n=1 Tax=Ceriporiopsis subvermispora (strain B) TaxID=914234 RepID=M2R8K3_CERS8|nr:hypothetical protein CERSUDRAFT_97362 [Gelatoporia subvermispora B]
MDADAGVDRRWQDQDHVQLEPRTRQRVAPSHQPAQSVWQIHLRRPVSVSLSSVSLFRCFAVSPSHARPSRLVVVSRADVPGVRQARGHARSRRDSRALSRSCFPAARRKRKAVHTAAAAPDITTPRPGNPSTPFPHARRAPRAVLGLRGDAQLRRDGAAIAARACVRCAMGDGRWVMRAPFAGARAPPLPPRAAHRTRNAAASRASERAGSPRPTQPALAHALDTKCTHGRIPAHLCLVSQFGPACVVMDSSEQ